MGYFRLSNQNFEEEINRLQNLKKKEHMKKQSRQNRQNRYPEVYETDSEQQFTEDYTQKQALEKHQQDTKMKNSKKLKPISKQKNKPKNQPIKQKDTKSKSDKEDIQAGNNFGSAQHKANQLTQAEIDQAEYEKILAEVFNFEPEPAPYMQPLSPGSKDKFTLVLDLDETLIHYEEVGNQGKFLIRPYTYKFLEEMAKYYEVVIFTAAMQDYADWILDLIDKPGYIDFRLYRQHTVPDGTHFIKDLSRLGRDLSKMIIVDNVPENFQEQPDNGIFIKSWYSDPQDTALSELAPLLRQIVQKNVKDVRDALKGFRKKMLENINKGIEDPHLVLDSDGNWHNANE